MDTSKTWDGTDFPLYPNGKPHIMVMKYTVPPHCRLAIHKHPVINVAYMLKGELMVKSENGDSVLVRSGEALAETIQTCHYGENPGNITVELVVFYATNDTLPIKEACSN